MRAVKADGVQVFEDDGLKIAPAIVRRRGCIRLNCMVEEYAELDRELWISQGIRQMYGPQI